MKIGPYTIAAAVIVGGLAVLAVNLLRRDHKTGMSRFERQRAEEQRFIQQYTGRATSLRPSTLPPPPMPGVPPLRPMSPPPPGARQPLARGAPMVQSSEWSKERIERVLAAAEAVVAEGEAVAVPRNESAAPVTDASQEPPEQPSKLRNVDPRSVQIALASTSDDIRLCFVKWAGGEPLPDDRIVAQFAIRDDDGDGVANPYDVSIVEASPGTPGTTACIGAVVSALEFMVPPQGVVRVTLPINLGPPRPPSDE